MNRTNKWKQQLLQNLPLTLTLAVNGQLSLANWPFWFVLGHFCCLATRDNQKDTCMGSENYQVANSWPIPPEFPLASVLPDALPPNWASILGLLSGSGDPPLTSCVALGKSLNLSDPQHPPLQMRIAVTIQPDEVVSTLGHPVSVALVIPCYSCYSWVWLSLFCISVCRRRQPSRTHWI